MDKYDSLLLKNQLCFPTYAVANKILRKYQPLLEKLDLTYTQYIVMMVLWEKKEITVNELGERVYLDSGTLSPLLTKLIEKGFVEKRKVNDGRFRLLCLTQEGEGLRQRCLDIPAKIGSCLRLSSEEAQALYHLCYKTLGGLEG